MRSLDRLGLLLARNSERIVWSAVAVMAAMLVYGWCS